MNRPQSSSKKQAISRRTFLTRSAIAWSGAGLFSIGRATAQPAKGRMIFLGFDGMEPRVVEEMLQRGELPNFTKLRDQGGFYDLTSTIPPQSPVAWNSFSTCKNPGGHNIFDFIRRDPNGAAGPMPYVGTGKIEAPILGPDGAVSKPARGVNYRKGTPFWSVADDQGIGSCVLNVPFAFPPDPLKNGRMMSGLGTPDIRGTNSTYFSLSDRFSPDKLVEDIAGGQRIALQFGGKEETDFPVPGPRDSRYRFGDPKAYTLATLHLKVDRNAGAGQVGIDGKSVELTQGQWSEWLEIPFKMSDSFTVAAIARFYPIAIGEAVRMYMTCVQYHPAAPYTPFTQPSDFGKAVEERYGLFKTVGWDLDTHALRQDDLPEDAFLADVEQTMAWRERITLDELAQGNNRLLISAWTDTDRVGHMFWRFRDPKHPIYDPNAPERWAKALETTYRRADAITGKVMEQLRPEDTLMVLSDHGFGTWRTGFELNTWLRDNGYLAINDPVRAKNGFLQGIDWANTKAYTIGLSSLYLNLQGREKKGAVTPEQKEALTAELRSRLLEVKDPSTGQAVFKDLHPAKVYHGEAMDQAPDIALGYNTAYQSSKACAKGGVGDHLFETNADKWSGEHASTEFTLCPGMLFSNRKLTKPTPHIQDLGVTALKLLGIDVPGDYEGDMIV